MGKQLSNSYPEYSKFDMTDIDRKIGQFWRDNDIFQKSIDNKPADNPFVFYEGPPSANGMPGIHHVISRTLKDLVCRYKTMQGYRVNRKAGWDTHGLPIELGVEKELGITKEDIGIKISVEDYNAKCKEVVMRFKDKWDSITEKMGYWVDLSAPYVTFENEYIESLWWALSELYKAGYLYKSVSIQPYSPAAGTGLSSHELNQPGTYKDVKDTSATVLFRLTRESIKILLDDDIADVFVMAWTTTPWTLPSNLGLTVGEKIDYVLIDTFNPYTHTRQRVILADALVHKYFSTDGKRDSIDGLSYTGAKGESLPYSILRTFKGLDILGLRYEQLLPYDSNDPADISGDPFRIIAGDFVTTEDGTGIVHTAPAFGADDYRVGQKNNLGIVTLVDREGKFIEGTGEYSGRFVKNYKDDPDYVDVNVDISVSLKQRGQAFKIEKYEHNYPHCWRTDKPILYYPLDAWFIKTSEQKERMISLNKTINWKPKSTGEGRFGNWLENMVDWNLSRSRFWGTPLPIWRTADGSEEVCICSVADLRERLVHSVSKGNMDADTDVEALTADLHKPYIDRIILSTEDGRPMYREPDLIDVWFDSGAMPFAQWHFPFENVDIFAKNYPADFIAEGVDQTRGWFYTLHALASLLKEPIQDVLKRHGYDYDDNAIPGVAYKTVVSNGLVLDKHGNKMSKRLGNVVDPFVTIDTYSADATRWYLVTNASPWDSLKFDTKGIEESQRKFFGTLYNTYQFFTLYANVDSFTFAEEYIPVSDRPELDQWILSALHTLIATVTDALDHYEPTIAGRAIEDFTDIYLSNWFVRLSRRRFWKGEYEHDKICAYQTLYECMETIAMMMAPISPFFADWLFSNLNNTTGKVDATSVHLSDFPISNADSINKSLEERMQLAMDISSLVLSLRKKENIRVRQPLQRILIPISNPIVQEQIERIKHIILSEVNVKEIEYIDAANSFINKKIKPNFKVLGKKVGAQMKALAEIIQNFSKAQIAEIEQKGHTQVSLDDNVYTIAAEDVEIISADVAGWSVAYKGSITVALDIHITESLEQEGIAREIINRLQKLRKDNNLLITDRINIYLDHEDTIRDTIQIHQDYIKSETLADHIQFTNEVVQEAKESIEIKDKTISINITKSS